MFIFHDQATEAKIIAEAATVTNEEMLAAINETPFYLFPEETQVKLSDLTPKDRKDINGIVLRIAGRKAGYINILRQQVVPNTDLQIFESLFDILQPLFICAGKTSPLRACVRALAHFISPRAQA